MIIASMRSNMPASYCNKAPINVAIQAPDLQSGPPQGIMSPLETRYMHQQRLKKPCTTLVTDSQALPEQVFSQAGL